MNYENIFEVKKLRWKLEKVKETSYSFNKHESRDQETEAWWSDPKKNWFKNIIELIIIIEAIIKTQKKTETQNNEDARKNVNE